MINPLNFTIETEVSPDYHAAILDFIYKYYLLPQPDRFSSIKNSSSKVLSFVLDSNLSDDKTLNDLLEGHNTSKNHGNNERLNNSSNNYVVHGKIESGEEIHITLTPEGNVSKNVLDQLAEDIFVAVQIFEENIRQSTIYFAWSEGQEIIPEKTPSIRKKASKSLFGSSLLLFYVLFFGINIILFILIGFYAVIFILLIQLVIVLLSDKIYMRMGEWKITPENPNIHIIQYQLPDNESKFFKENLGENALMKVKKEIYDGSLAIGESPTCEIGEKVLSKYGFHCSPSRQRARVINVYEIVKEAADKFGIDVPKIIVSNNMLPNAAATGPSPSRGLVLITTGLLVQLDEEEILSVIGHEMGHLVGRDPIILLSIVSGEFILRLTILLPLVLISPIIYIVVAMGLIFFVAKFFEARADLLSAKVIGKPEILAEALRKIGYSRLQFERMPSYRISSWIMWDPHPPIYFRIKRLENLKNADKIKNPLIRSAKDVFKGFRDSFKG